MMVIELCLFCKHDRTDKGEVPHCVAFPGEIPQTIMRMDHDHRQPFPGDRGIRFELDPNLDPKMLAIYREHYERQLKTGRTG